MNARTLSPIKLAMLHQWLTEAEHQIDFSPDACARLLGRAQALARMVLEDIDPDHLAPDPMAATAVQS